MRNFVVFTRPGELCTIYFWVFSVHWQFKGTDSLHIFADIMKNT